VGGGLDVDVVRPHSRPGDDAQAPRADDRGRRDACAAAYNDGLSIGEGHRQGIVRQTGLDDHVERGAKALESLRRQPIRHDDLHRARNPAAAASTAAPRFTG